MKKFEFNFKPSVSFIVKAFAGIMLAIMCINAYNMGKESGFGLEAFIEREYEYEGIESEKLINSKVEAITVNWHCGEVKVIQKTGNITRIYETSSRELQHGEHMDVSIEGTELTVNWSDQWAGASKELAKCLVIELPEGVKRDSLIIRAGDSDVKVENGVFYSLNVGTRRGGIEFKNLSGESAKFGADEDIRGKNCSFESLSVKCDKGDIVLEGFNAYELDTFASVGSILFEGDFAYLNAKTYKGDIEAGTSYKPKDINVSSTYGNVTLYLPSNLSSLGGYNTVSGKFITDLDFKDEDEGVLAMNAEENELNLTTTSGDINLIKGEKANDNAFFKELLGEDEEE